jgi:hypothetical protein
MATIDNFKALELYMVKNSKEGRRTSLFLLWGLLSNYVILEQKYDRHLGIGGHVFISLTKQLVEYLHLLR